MVSAVVRTNCYQYDDAPKPYLVLKLDFDCAVVPASFGDKAAVTARFEPRRRRPTLFEHTPQQLHAAAEVDVPMLAVALDGPAQPSQAPASPEAAEYLA